MKLEYDQWLNMLSSEYRLKESKVDIARNDLVRGRKDIQKELFDLLYNNRYLNFSYKDKSLKFAVDEDKIVEWNKRQYKSYDTYLFLKEKVPQLLNQKSVTRNTAEKIALVLDGMKFCEQLLSTKTVASNPIETKTTKEFIENENHYTGTQMEIPFDFDGNGSSEANVVGGSKTIVDGSAGLDTNVNNKKSSLTEEQMDDLYGSDDDEEWWKH